jgi:hypothetical protein
LVLPGVNAKAARYPHLMAQPVGLPGKMIAAVAPELFGPFPGAWRRGRGGLHSRDRQDHVASPVEAVGSTAVGYRGTATIDLATDEAGRAAAAQLSMLVDVVSHDRGRRGSASMPCRCAGPGFGPDLPAPWGPVTSWPRRSRLRSRPSSRLSRPVATPDLDPRRQESGLVLAVGCARKQAMAHLDVAYPD